MWPFSIAIIGILAMGIVVIATYSAGHDAGLGKPRPQRLLPVGTMYVPLRVFGNNIADNGKGIRCIVLEEDGSGDLSLCDISGEPIPEGKKLVAVRQSGGNVHFVPVPSSPKPHINVIA